MTNEENLGFERVWIQQRIRSISNTRQWMKTASEIMDKYNFDELYPIIVSFLRRSNEILWESIDIATTESRIYEEPLSLEKYTQIIKELENKLDKGSDTEEIKETLLYYKENYNLERNTLKKIKELNYNYNDFDLFEFFANNVEKLYNLIKNMPKDESSLDDDELFKLYFANLFGHKINGCGIDIEENEIKITQNSTYYDKV
jgi:hypothetical protein